MKGGYLYTILFMLILSIVLTTILALANNSFLPIIRNNKDNALKKAVLEAFGEQTGDTPAEIESVFAQKIRAKTIENGTLYFLVDGGQVNGVAVPFIGSGLWGTIRGYLAVTPAKDKILGLVFTAQNETPGLGGRIDEPAYRDQFRGLAIALGTPLAYGPGGDSQLDAIAGATQTSGAVLRIVNQLKDDVLPGLEVVP